MRLKRPVGRYSAMRPTRRSATEFVSRDCRSQAPEGGAHQNSLAILAQQEVAYGGLYMGFFEILVRGALQSAADAPRLSPFNRPGAPESHGLRATAIGGFGREFADQMRSARRNLSGA